MSVYYLLLNICLRTWYLYYLTFLSANEDAGYMYGVCAHGLGLLREAVHVYDQVLKNNSLHFVFYLRNIAMLQHENLDRTLSTYNLDHMFDRGKPSENPSLTMWANHFR